MTEIKRDNGEPIKIFAETFEYDAYEQVKRIGRYPAYAGSKIRIMPDAHAGKGCTVGTTMTITDRVTPNLVGVDIGCGMLAVRLKHGTDYRSGNVLTALDDCIRRYIPSGNGIHDEPCVRTDILDELFCRKNCDTAHALRSIGSLGGGNHFIEIDHEKETDSFWLIIHSGSRHLGLQVCQHYQNLAFRNLNEMKSIKEKTTRETTARCIAEGRRKDIPKELETALAAIRKPSADKELAHLEGDCFLEYIHDMEFTQQYAALNRATMASIILKRMNWTEDDRFETVHNYIDTELMILRKGAVSAQKGERLLIPINMRDGSLICKGKGNEDWNFSAPHGAGRLMSRSAAKQKISMDEYTAAMQGIHTTCVNPATIDESPMAYKSMEEILRCIEPTAEVISAMKPVYNFKA